MAQQATGPKYRRIEIDLRTSIADGTYPPGAQLPTKADLMARYGVAVNTVERAIEELRRDGLVVTAQGSGMFVADAPPGIPPAAPATTAASADSPARTEDLEAQVAELRGDLARLQAAVMNLYHSTGQPYPYGQSEARADRRAV
jgi:DNA-binding GntR family transcriptional regulator